MNHERLQIKTRDARAQINADSRIDEMTGRRFWRGRKGKFNPDSEYCADAVTEYIKQGGKVTRLPGPKEKHGAVE
jgi:hypothetical protein